MSGGEDYKKPVYHILTKLFTKNVAIEYSLLGRKGKKKFTALNTYKAVVGKHFSEFAVSIAISVCFYQHLKCATM